MTVKDICETFQKLPQHLPVTVYLEGELTVSDHTGDRINGFYSGMLDVDGIGQGEIFTAGGVSSAVVFKIGDIL